MTELGLWFSYVAKMGKRAPKFVHFFTQIWVFLENTK